jgi:hypothetical protein
MHARMDAHADASGVFFCEGTSACTALHHCMSVHIHTADKAVRSYGYRATCLIIVTHTPTPWSYGIGIIGHIGGVAEVHLIEGVYCYKYKHLLNWPIVVLHVVHLPWVHVGWQHCTNTTLAQASLFIWQTPCLGLHR